MFGYELVVWPFVCFFFVYINGWLFDEIRKIWWPLSKSCIFTWNHLTFRCTYSKNNEIMCWSKFSDRMFTCSKSASVTRFAKFDSNPFLANVLFVSDTAVFPTTTCSFFLSLVVHISTLFLTLPSEKLLISQFRRYLSSRFCILKYNGRVFGKNIHSPLR